MIAALWCLGSPLVHASVIPPSTEGRYVLTISSRTRTRVPVLGWVPSTTVSTVLIDLFRKPTGGWAQRHEVCSVEISSEGRRAQTTIPEAFVRALPVKRYDVSIDTSGDSWSYVADLGLDHVGYDPSAASELPRRPDDPGVLDPDGDGHPGMTVRLDVPLIGAGDLYVVQRADMRLEGSFTSPTRIDGRVVVSVIEQRTLKSTHPLFGGSPTLQPVAEGSVFQMVRTPGATCGSLAGPP